MHNSKIQWTHHTLNPWIGCAKVHAGCANCYAENLMATRFKRVVWGPRGTRERTSQATWQSAIGWNAIAESLGERHRVFCASLADVFEDRPELAPWRQDLFNLIDATPNLDWLLLTKRPENVPQMWYSISDGVTKCQLAGRAVYRENVWIGTSVSAIESLNLINDLIALRVYARRLFVSVEPLLDEVNLGLGNWVREYPIDWFIVGGESGPQARPCRGEWIYDIICQCGYALTPVFVKQLGANAWWRGRPLHLADAKGGDPSEWPTELRFRQFPEESIASF